ncbi:ribbon-helix-helix protein, CopG family [Caenimonas sp. SL110]|uniref:ribbon-helix-helix protein, CopG family n=1 Tax=Caenimonas sp. SL110 TaxID=1450524 RepID=UPI0006528AB5|nr:ribbon-helix-helix protein, CopG family [Caenimonas sp. SL110]
MAVSVRMDPVLERELEAAAKRMGQTKSQFIVDAVERALGRKNPYELLLQVQEEVAEYAVAPAGTGKSSKAAAKGADVADAASAKQRVRAVLEQKHQALQDQWAQDRAAPAVAARPVRPARSPRAK